MAAAIGEMVCTNHAKRTTSLRCNRCERPMCLRCVELTAVGHRCKECLGKQRAGYYNATPFDHALAAVVALIPSIIAGAVVPYAYFYLALLGGPIGGAIVSEAVRVAVGRRRGRFLWAVVCGAIVAGGVVGVVGWMIATAESAVPIATLAPTAFGSFAIYAALAVITVYARLRV
jgi:hypothetical protein